MIINKYPQATLEEIEKLQHLVKKIDKEAGFVSKEVNIPAPARPVSEEFTTSTTPSKIDKRFGPRKFNGEIRSVLPSRAPLTVGTPVELLMLLRPELNLHKWQFEELMAIAGYTTVGKYGKNDKSVITRESPLKSIIAAANGSGKDDVIISAASVWYALTGLRNRIIITSSSHDQIKYQTEPSIDNLCKRANARFGKIFHSVQFHHVCPELGSEIKLFATDEAGKAEGYHAWDDGGVMCIINEAKSVKEDIFEAIARWRGVTHRLEISSPGRKFGHFFRASCDAVHYPDQRVLGRNFHRRITSFDCPHISKYEIDNMINEWGESSPVVRSSIYAEFSDVDEPIIISEALFDKVTASPPIAQGDDIGIGLDLAAGGDENACFVRRGNRVIHKFFFRQVDTDLAVSIIDKQLEAYKDTQYTFHADNGGVSHAMNDKLSKLGWRIRRTNNQSPSHNKREFLNLGAETWFYIKRLLEKNQIVLPSIPKLREQLTTRYFRGFESTQGKFALESKPEAKASGRPSPDRADAFILCFWSYRPNQARPAAPRPGPQPNFVTLAQAMLLQERDELFVNKSRQTVGRSTLLNGKI